MDEPDLQTPEYQRSSYAQSGSWHSVNLELRCVAYNVLPRASRPVPHLHQHDPDHHAPDAAMANHDRYFLWRFPHPAHAHGHATGQSWQSAVQYSEIGRAHV